MRQVEQKAAEWNGDERKTTQTGSARSKPGLVRDLGAAKVGDPSSAVEPCHCQSLQSVESLPGMATKTLDQPNAVCPGLAGPHVHMSHREPTLTAQGTSE